MRDTPASTESLPIALDAMGGDHAPREVVRGAVLAMSRLPGLRVTLVGRAADIQREIRVAPGMLPAYRERMDIVEAREVVGMQEHPAQAVRSKRDSSVVRACALVASGRAGAVVSAGNSGAVLAAALFTVRRIEGVARPAIGTSLPNPLGQTFMLDVGANTDCRPEWLAQFAVMGSVYAREMLHIARPRVGLLSNGEERDKGSQLVQAALPLLEAMPVHCIGNVESKEIFKGGVDVVVTDGFTGNIALKTAEGVGEFLFASIAREARGSLGRKLGGLLLKGRLRPLRDQVDYRRTGGALLLGVAGEVVIAHGRSDAEAIYNALRVAGEAVRADVSGRIAHAVREASTQAPSETHDTAPVPGAAVTPAAGAPASGARDGPGPGPGTTTTPAKSAVKPAAPAKAPRRRRRGSPRTGAGPTPNEAPLSE